MPSPGIQRREPPHNPQVFIGDDFVRISDVVITICYAIVAEIAGVNRVQMFAVQSVMVHPNRWWQRCCSDKDDSDSRRG